MQKEYALILAWPATKCKQAGAWYDGLMHYLGFSKNGYYKVGHAGIVLINQLGEPHYFDFGRYHAPYGNGRVRDKHTDYDLELKTRIEKNEEGNLNIEKLIEELQYKKACHGDGVLEVSLVEIDFNKAFCKAKTMQNRGFIPYGPFVRKGTNCSRFVQVVASKGMRFGIRKILLNLPLMLTPTPMWNVLIGKRLKNKKKNLLYVKNIKKETQIVT